MHERKKKWILDKSAYKKKISTKFAQKKEKMNFRQICILKKNFSQICMKERKKEKMNFRQICILKKNFSQICLKEKKFQPDLHERKKKWILDKSAY